MRLALVHGFTQTGASWDPVRVELERMGYEVVCPDLPGHGTAAGIRAGVPESASRLAADVGEAVWVGYSMGGRVTLDVALEHPDVVRALVLVSTTAGIEDEEERAARRAGDEQLAADLERMGVAAFIDRWLAAPMWATLPRDRAGVESRLTNTAAGLASSLRLAGTGAQASRWSRVQEVRAPTLIITGTADAKFTALGDRLAAAVRGADRIQLTGAGHALPWERPEEFAAAVRGWLDRQRMSPTVSSNPKTS